MKSAGAMSPDAGSRLMGVSYTCENTMALVKSLPDGSSRLAGGVTAPTRSTWDGDVTSQTVPLFGGGFPEARQS